MSICLYIYYAHTHTHKYLCIYIHIFVHICIYIYSHIHSDIHIQIHVCIYVDMYIYPFITYTHAHTRTRTHSHTHTHTQTHTHTCTYTYPPLLFLVSFPLSFSSFCRARSLPLSSIQMRVCAGNACVCKTSIQMRVYPKPVSKCVCVPHTHGFAHTRISRTHTHLDTRFGYCIQMRICILYPHAFGHCIQMHI